MRTLVFAAVVCSACDALVHVDALDIRDAGPHVDAPVTTGPRIVFVTASTYTADLTGGVSPDAIAGAADKCQAEAQGAHLTNVFLAWLSTTDRSTSPANKMSQGGGPFVLAGPAHTVVAATWQELASGTLQHPISTTAKGNPVAGNGCDVWTNTSVLGTPADSAPTNDCYEFTTLDQGIAVIAGSVIDSDSRWTTNACNLSCMGAAHLYCIEQ